MPTGCSSISAADPTYVPRTARTCTRTVAGGLGVAVGCVRLCVRSAFRCACDLLALRPAAVAAAGACRAIVSLSSQSLDERRRVRANIALTSSSSVRPRFASRVRKKPRCTRCSVGRSVGRLRFWVVSLAAVLSAEQAVSRRLPCVCVRV